MCNEFSRRLDLDLLILGLQQAGIARLSRSAAQCRAAGERAHHRSERHHPRWPGQGGKPVYNYRGEGRDFRNSARQGRCLVPVDGFYEFTAPADPAAKRKDKWLFRCRDAAWFAIAGLWKRDEAAIPDSRHEAFTLLTCAPGPDIAPFHHRQVALLPPDRWAGWLDGSIPARQAIGPSAAGTLVAERT